MSQEGILSKSLANRLWPFVLVTIALVFAMYPTIEGVGERWLRLDESYSHGFLLAAVSVFLTFRAARRHSVIPGIYPLWLLPFGVCLLTYWIGGLIRLQALQHLALIPAFFFAYGALLGARQLRWFIIPFGLLFLTIPVWDFLAWTLQLITVAVNKVLLGAFGIDFEVEGVFVHLVGVGTFEVAHGCSGLRYLLVGQALVLIYGELYLSRFRSQLALFGIGVAFAMIANWIRVFVIFYMGYETNMQSSLIEDHESFGWWVFAGTLIPIFFLARWLESRDDEAVKLGQCNKAQVIPESGGAWVAVVVIGVFSFFSWYVAPDERSAITTLPEKYRISLGQDYAPAFGSQLDGWSPTIRNPDRTYSQTAFNRNDAHNDKGLNATYYLGVFTYKFQRHRAELIQYSNRLYDRDNWVPETFFEVPNDLGLPVQGLTLKNRLSGKLVHIGYSYFVQGQWETDQWRAKLAQVAGFFNGRDDASLLVSAVSCEDCDAPSLLTAFVENTFPDAIELINQDRAR